MEQLAFRLVDVFASAPLCGNGLTVIITKEPIGVRLMQALTIELRQFETIYLTPTEKSDSFAARVFTMEEELDFAGHPVIGAGAVLHELADASHEARWTIRLNRQQVRVESRRTAQGFEVSMQQAAPAFGPTIDPVAERDLLDALGLQVSDRDTALPMRVVSTGLPYLVVPVSPAGLERARIGVDNLEERLGHVGAKFVYVLDSRAREGRTWDNLGRVEDIATGSAAGPVAAYLVAHGLANADEEIILRQGRHAGRPSLMRLVVMQSPAGKLIGVRLAGDVRMIARGSFDPAIFDHFNRT